MSKTKPTKKLHLSLIDNSRIKKLIWLIDERCKVDLKMWDNLLGGKEE